MKTYSLVFGAGDPRQFSGMSPTFLIFYNITGGASVAPPAITESFTPTCGIYQFQWGATTSIIFLADAATTSPGANARYIAGQLDAADRPDEFGTTMIAIGTTLFGQGVTNIALGTTNVSLGTTLVGYGVSNIALGNSNIALGTSNIALGTTILAGLVNEGVTLVSIGNSLAVIGQSLSVIIPAIGSTASSFGNSTTDPSTLFGYLKRIQENLEGDSQYVKVTGVWTIQDRAASVTLAVKTIANNATMVVKS